MPLGQTLAESEVRVKKKEQYFLITEGHLFYVMMGWQVLGLLLCQVLAGYFDRLDHLCFFSQGGGHRLF